MMLRPIGLNLSVVALVLTSLSGLSQGWVSPSSASARILSTAAAPQKITTQKSTTNLADVATGFDNFCIEQLEDADEVDPEAARKYRRTVYTHDDWKKHRSQDRFQIYLGSLFDSGVFRNSEREVYTVTGVAVLVCLYNALANGYTDFAGVEHAGVIGLDKIGLPLSAFTITSSALGLLLTFRANTSYKRWDEARKNWGMNINHTRDLVRMANTYYDRTGVSPEKREEDLHHVALCTWAFVRAMKRHLSPEEEDEQDFCQELYEKLPEEQAAKIIAAAHRPNRALQDLSYAIEVLPMHFARKNEIHQAVTIFEDDLGSSERLLTSPVPLFYSRHTARVVGIWLLLLPLALYDAYSYSWNHIVMIPATFVTSAFLLGVEELATQLEEPFTILPMQAFCDKIYNWCMEIVSWSPGDNGRDLKPVKPEHAYFLPGPSAANGYTHQAPPRAAQTPPSRQYAAQPPPGRQPEPKPVPEEMTAAALQAGGGLPPPSPSLSMEEFLKRQGS